MNEKLRFRTRLSCSELNLELEFSKSFTFVSKTDFADSKFDTFVTKSKFCAFNIEISVSNFESFFSKSESFVFSERKSEIILTCVSFHDCNSST